MQTIYWSHLQECCFQEAEAELEQVVMAAAAAALDIMEEAVVQAAVLVQAVVVQEVHSLLLAL
jgi:hypothetical protein